MDSITHIALGGILAPALFGSRLGRVGWIVGAIAATLPDADILLRTGDSVLDHVMHRSFTHALVMAPIIGFLAALPFAATRRFNPLWRPLVLVGVLAALSHMLLDACTSYGTQLFWPFSTRRFSWDLLAIVDPIFTLPLVVGLIWSQRKKSARIARTALGVAAVYVALAALQHERAANVQRALMASRGYYGTHARVIPVIGTICGYRSIYEEGGTLHCDAIRVPLYARGVVREGAQIAQARPTDLPTDSPAAISWRRFDEFADGFVARPAERPDVLADMRYSAAADAFRPFWGVRILGDRAEWASLSAENARSLRTMWRDMVGAGTWSRVEDLP